MPKQDSSVHPPKTARSLVEDPLLVGDELAYAVGDLHRAALEFQHEAMPFR